MANRRKKSFFGKQEPHSAIKAAIVSDYFAAWAKILSKRSDRVLYLDPFCGPGKYDDESGSTPLLILRKVLENAALRQRVVTIFGDQDPKAIERLAAATQELPGIGELKYRPLIQAGVVTDALQAELAAMILVPTLMFLDPFGYKAVNADIVRAIIKNRGSECIFFFNYNRIMPAITNPGVRHLVDAIFGKERVDDFQESFESSGENKKEATMISALRESMKEIGAGYTLPFRFRKGGRTIAHLVFVSTNPLGHKIMKEIMGNRSSDSYQGVSSFEFREGALAIHMFAAPPTPLDDLKGDLLSVFAGRSLPVLQVFEEHNLGTPYVLKNYKEALKELMRERRIPEGTRDHGKRRPAPPYRTMPDDVLITFPGS